MIHRCITERRRIPTPHGPLTLLILRPAAPTGEPGMLWIHGGGYVTGMAAMLHFSRARALARKYGAVVLSPEYRLAPRHPYPAAPEDCYAALLYLRDHAAELGCDPSRLMVGGESAGGGLKAAVCMLARDRGQVRVAVQMPL